MINNNGGLSGRVRPQFPNKTLDWRECCYFDMNDAVVVVKKSIIWLVGLVAHHHSVTLMVSAADL